MNNSDPWGDKKIEFKMPNFKYKGLLLSLIAIVLILLWLASGVFIVKPNEQAIVKRFGKIIKIVGPGPHYHLPYPIETIDKAEVTKVHRIEIGFRSLKNGGYKTIKEESLMLTGDENIVNIDFIVQYKIYDISKYLYNVVDVPKTIKDAAEATIREVAGKENIDEILTTGKNRIQIETQKILQRILDDYQTGVKIVAVQLQDVEPPAPVIKYFKDVASAREDKNRYINEAEAYANEIIPQARAKAASMILEAEAYQKEKIEKAKGDAYRFIETLKSYKSAPEITKKRLYFDTMEKILKRSEKYIFDSDIKNLSPIIGLDGLNQGVKK
ncbi:membrane protease subunit HflK [Deferribacter desulfuricans SSM1]|uniref:Protein HflK n=1 Tax=Deferribacter desulfuricans (strain DSM 14783 / JCM 11476 / NBRC 101012 / SSM1) TaxID=639282 RepID=D3PEH2_DEFDS|nr:FtsH protease activity modulator HflK [Deferribacter desulfuricans]BAI80995.1 membrane protease subunit HflK [Deferribacter desulfuricans SSM1]